jgi:penicillin-binding protein 1C
MTSGMVKTGKRAYRFILRWKYSLAFLAFCSTGYGLLLSGPLFHDPVSTVIFDRNGMLLGARVARDGQWRFPGNQKVPDKIRQATLAFEDRYFYFHPGFNPASLARAAWLNLKAGKVLSGGSTITMQTIRLSRKDKPRSVREKLVEIILATRLELKYSKSEILALYLSHAPYGGNVVGCEAASWRYFDTGSGNLTWAEAATLAVLPNSPALVHPGKNRPVLLQKRNRLLQRLARMGWIDSTTLQVSLAEAIPDNPVPVPKTASHLLDRFCRDYPGAISRTTVDASLQQQVNALVEKHHKKLQLNEIHNAAAIVLEVETGNVLAYVGNCSFQDDSHSGAVDIIASSRSTGSLLKPLLYAAMLEDGKILPASLVPDIPLNLNGFAPVNFNGQFEGAVQAGRALSRSLNVPAVQLLKGYGVERFHHLIRSLGMKTLNQPARYYGLSLILGGAEGNLAEMSNIYAVLSRILNHYCSTGLYYTTDYRPPNYRFSAVHRQEEGSRDAGLLNASSVWYTYRAMEEVNRPDEEEGWKQFSSTRKIAWKTGTSFGYRDGWAVGTSPDFVVGVWVGNADGEGRPGLTGIATAAPLMFEIFQCLPASGWFGTPTDELSLAGVCRESGYLAGPNCPDPDTVKIPVNGLRSPSCPFHRMVHLTRDLHYRVSSSCYPVDSMTHLSWFVLPPVQEWYYKRRHQEYKSLPPFKKGCEPMGQQSMDLLYPRDEVKVFIPKELGGNKGRVIFEAVHNNPNAVIYWHLDNRFIAATRNIHQVELLPEAGQHVLTLVDDTGEELVRKFEAVEP